DSESEAALVPMAELEVARGRFARALPLCAALTRLGENLPATEKAGRYKMLGRVQAELGDFRAALSAYEHAWSAGAGDTDALWGVVEAAYRLGEWARAQKCYSDLLTLIAPGEFEQRACAYLGRGRVSIA